MPCALSAQSQSPIWTISGEEEAVLTNAPAVPPPLGRNHNSKVIIRIETIEQTGRLADGVEYVYWTFGGSVPGKFMRIMEGDLVEFHLKNNQSSKMPHNIDLHAVTGPGGGAASSFVAPGQTAVFNFKALNPGLYVYHCATAPVGMHIANGMYGLILVEPRTGIHTVDREYYVMQSEFYTEGAHGKEGLQPFNMEKALREQPEYVVFNGSEGALSGDNAITAKVGETVRLYIGNGGPNLISSFHVIGEIFDLVYGEGGSIANQKNVQTTLIPAGGSSIVEFKVDVPGTYILVDHSIFRAFNKGALGMLKVEGKENKDIYSGRLEEGIYQKEGSALQSVGSSAAPATATSKAQRIEAGSRTYAAICAACHQPTGLGIPGAFPPLAKSDYIKADKLRAVSAVVHGLSGPVTVNGQKFNSVMPAVTLSDDEVANVVTYVLNNFGNDAGDVTSSEVAKVRASK
ncbi:MAG: copper-containing nitrite reductase [Verrucomicrobiota bacterium]|nr:copper-containing nitrite reductase [Verrucomicrobiota bacterium]